MILRGAYGKMRAPRATSTVRFSSGLLGTKGRSYSILSPPVVSAATSARPFCMGNFGILLFKVKVDIASPRAAEHCAPVVQPIRQ